MTENVMDSDLLLDCCLSSGPGGHKQQEGGPVVSQRQHTHFLPLHILCRGCFSAAASPSLGYALVVGCHCVFPFTYNRNLSLGAKAEIASDKLTFPLKNHTRRDIATMMAENQPEKV